MEPFSLVIFGITGNLAEIKLLPALYDLSKNGLLPDDFQLLGIARSEKNNQEFRDYIKNIIKTDFDEKAFNRLTHNAHYISGNFKDEVVYKKVREIVGERNTMYYLATYPELYKSIFDNLKQFDLHHQNNSWTRIIIEKPLGHDLNSAKSLNQLLGEYFTEDQIFRVDHYLGKETMQNILNFRFGNDIFEPLLNHEYIDSIQITAAEDFGIGMRGGYYDNMGALRDVGQNHLIQMLALTTMESPQHFSNEAITAERMKIIKALKPLPESIVFGQYEGYLDEEHVTENSQTDTFFALKTEIDNERFRGVPVYVRAGKMLARQVTEVSFVYKLPGNRLFSEIDCGLERNVLTYRISPNEGIVVKILAKTPGHKNKITPSYMQFCYKNLPGKPADAYEKLIYDALRGDGTFFNDADEVESQWQFVDPLVNAKNNPHIYKKGSWGPDAADELIKADGREWIEPSVEFCQF